MNKEELDKGLKVSRYTEGQVIYNFIKEELPFEEVMKLYRLLEEDINKPVVLTQTTPNTPITKEMLDAMRRRWLQ